MKEYLLKEFTDVFQGVGRLPGQPYQIRMKENYTLVQHHHDLYQLECSMCTKQS